MKSFFKIFLACFFAIVAFIGFFILFFVVISMFGSKGEGVNIKNKSILVINTNVPISAIGNSDIMASIQGLSGESISFYKILNALNQAKSDKKIVAIYLNLKQNAISSAYLDEIRDKLKELRKAGKIIYAYGDVIDQSSYYLASVVNKFYVNPQGMIMLKGYAARVAYYKDLMDKLGVKPEIVYAGNFKSATEPYRLNAMSDYNKLQMQELTNDYFDILVNDIAASRSLDTQDVRQIINNVSALLPDSALKFHIIDDIKYENEVLDELSKSFSIERKNIQNHFVHIEDYPLKELKNSSNRVALVHLDGTIQSSLIDKDVENITANKYRSILEELRMNDKVKAVVLHVNSPGGDVVASEIIYNEVKLLQKTKPVVVYMSNMAASGGYYISAPAQKIFAQKHTITGSIGVFSMSFDVHELLNNKLGVNYQVVQSGRNSDYGNIARPRTEEEKALTQKMIDNIYESFKYKVSVGRKIPLDSVSQIAQGRIYSGSRALSIGLVDQIGSLESSIKEAAILAKVGDYSVQEYPLHEESFIYEILKNITKTQDSKIYTYAPEILKLQYQLKEMHRINGQAQMHIPFQIEGI